MRHAGLLVFFLPLLPSLALAQDAPTKSKGLADCAALVASVPDIVMGPDAEVEDIEGGCRATDIRFAVSDFLHYGVEEITLVSPNLLNTFPTGEVFVAADLTVTGAQVMPQTGSPLQDYILGISMARMDMRLDYTTDPGAGTADVAFHFSVERLGQVDLRATLSNFDNTDIPLGDVSDIIGTVDTLDISLRDRGFVATILAPPLLGTLPSDEDPVPAIMAMEETLVAMLAGLPETTLSPDSLATLGTLIRSFPHADGDWTLSLSTPTGLPLDILSNDPAGLAPLLANARIEATGTPAAE